VSSVVNSFQKQEIVPHGTIEKTSEKKQIFENRAEKTGLQNGVKRVLI